MSRLDSATEEGLRGILEASDPVDQMDYPPKASTVKIPQDEVPPTMAKPAGVLGMPDETFSDIELDTNQTEALAAYKELAGSSWKTKLKQCWKDGAYDEEIDENTRIALEQVKTLVGEDGQPVDVAGDVSGKAKLMIKTEAKNKFPWEEIGQLVLGKLSSPEMQEEVAQVAGIDFTSDPEAWSAFYAELAGKFKSIGFLSKTKPKKADSKPKDDSDDDDDDEPAPEPDDEMDMELDVGAPEFEPAAAPSAAPAAAPSSGPPPFLSAESIKTSDEPQVEATDDILNLAIGGDVDAAIARMMSK